MMNQSSAIFHYCCIYMAKGIYNPDPGLNSLLLKDDNVTVRLIGSNSYEDLVARIISPQGAENFDDLNDKTKEKIITRRQSLILKTQSHAVICVESCLPLDIVESYHKDNSETPTYVEAPLKSNAESAFKSVSAAMTFARGSQLSKDYDFIYEQYYLTDSQLKKIKNLDPARTSSGDTMAEINLNDVLVAKALSSVFHRDKAIKEIISIYSESLTPYKSGHLHAFIAAWTALEIFVAKQFKELKSSVTININGIEAHKKFSDRMLDVMKDKYRLLDKFSALSSFYNSLDSDKDISEFKRIKDIRDNFFHKMEGEVKDLPLNETRQLFSKYFRLYLEKNKEDSFLQESRIHGGS